MDPITLELYRHRFASVSEEMGITLRRTAYSPNIKERLDFSCALFDGTGKMVAQAAHIPAHLGAMPASVATVLPLFPDWQPGDVVIVNDPFQGGNHLPDITMISPVFLRAMPMAMPSSPPNPQSPITPSPSFFVASRAHHADVGGMTPGSLPLSTEIYQEGIIIPPVRLMRGGVMNEDLLRLILRNVRTPDERRGDIAAQRAAHAIGERRLLELVDRHGADEVLAYAGHLQRYTEQLTRSAIAAWPDGRYEFEDVIELVIESKAGDEVSLVPLRAGRHHRRGWHHLRFYRHRPHDPRLAQHRHGRDRVRLLLRRALHDGGERGGGRAHERRGLCAHHGDRAGRLHGQRRLARRGGRGQCGDLPAHRGPGAGGVGQGPPRQRRRRQPRHDEQRHHGRAAGGRHPLCLLRDHRRGHGRARPRATD